MQNPTPGAHTIPLNPYKSRQIYQSILQKYHVPLSNSTLMSPAAEPYPLNKL